MKNHTKTNSELSSLHPKQNRVAILLPDLRGGGAERVSVNLANQFVRLGYAVDMVLVAAVGEFLSDLKPEVRVVDLSVSRFRQVGMPLFRYLRENRPQVLIANMWPLTVISIFVASISKVNTRLVVVEHTTWSRSELLRRRFAKQMVRWTMRVAFPWAGAVVTVSEGAADDLALFSGLDRRKITVLYNPVVGEAQKSMDLSIGFEQWWKGDHKKILAVGTLKPIKDYPFLLRAFAELRKSVDARLLILGDGEERQKLVSLVDELELQEDVFMPGFVQSTYSYFDSADVFVLSSRAEGFGNVLVEALAVGTPVVSTKCPSGPDEILEGGKYGKLVPLGDAQAFVQAISNALKESPDRDLLRSRAKDFSVETISNQYLDVMFPRQSSKEAR